MWSSRLRYNHLLIFKSTNYLISWWLNLTREDERATFSTFGQGERKKRGCSKGLILASVIGRKLACFSPK